jgi:NAD(P)H dehydrogenase (quinone)
MSDTTDLFLITGATGKTGAPTVELLRQRGFRVRALVHSRDDRATRLRELGAEVVHGDLLDFDAVSSAMVGVAAAYFCYPIYPPRLLEATAIFAQAATEAGVGAVVNMSQSAARREARYYGPREHWIAERLLDRTPMMTTHLRPTLFADWLTWQWVRHESQGVLRLPFGIARHAPIASADQARVIAAILANPAPHDRQVYPLRSRGTRSPRDCRENIEDAGHSGPLRTRRRRIFCGRDAGPRSVSVPRAVPEQRGA